MLAFKSHGTEDPHAAQSLVICSRRNTSCILLPSIGEKWRTGVINTLFHRDLSLFFRFLESTLLSNSLLLHASLLWRKQ